MAIFEKDAERNDTNPRRRLRYSLHWGIFCDSDVLREGRIMKTLVQGG